VVGWDDPPPRRRTGLVVAVVLLLALAVAGGVAATMVWIGAGAGDGDRQGSGTETPDPDPSGTGGPDDPEVPEDRIGFGATFALADDCLVNDAAGDADPRMRILPCDSDEDGPVYRVLERFNEQVSGQSPQEQDESAQQICAEVDGYQVFYRFVGASEDQSFVLCMVVEE
jgi:hypothetical protein